MQQTSDVINRAIVAYKPLKSNDHVNFNTIYDAFAPSTEAEIRHGREVRDARVRVVFEAENEQKQHEYNEAIQRKEMELCRDFCGIC